MELQQVQLSKKEEEIVKAVKLGALSNLTEKSENLITIEDMAVYVSRHYNNVCQQDCK